MLSLHIFIINIHVSICLTCKMAVQLTRVSVSKLLRLDFSDEMETLKVELKRAGKLDDAPKVGTCRRLIVFKICHRANRYSMIFGYSDTEVIEDDCGGVVESIHWRNEEIMKIRNAFGFSLDQKLQGIAQKDPAATMDPRQAVNSAPWPVENSFEWSLLSWIILVTGEHDLSILRSVYQYVYIDILLRTILSIGE